MKKVCLPTIKFHVGAERPSEGFFVARCTAHSSSGSPMRSSPMLCVCVEWRQKVLDPIETLLWMSSLLQSLLLLLLAGACTQQF